MKAEFGGHSESGRSGVRQTHFETKGEARITEGAGVKVLEKLANLRGRRTSRERLCHAATLSLFGGSPPEVEEPRAYANAVSRTIDQTV